MTWRFSVLFCIYANYIYEKKNLTGKAIARFDEIRIRLATQSLHHDQIHVRVYYLDSHEVLPVASQSLGSNASATRGLFAADLTLNLGRSTYAVLPKNALLNFDFACFSFAIQYSFQSLLCERLVLPIEIRPQKISPLFGVRLQIM